MGLTGALRRLGSAAPHVLLVPVPGGRAVRWEAERELRRRGWYAAESPAQADVLLVCGAPGPRLGPVLDRTWAALPVPRARALAPSPAVVASVLDSAQEHLRQADLQQADADTRASSAAVRDGDLPGGLRMADREPDRDGLDLDVLHLTLGPVLPHWPPGLLLDVRMQGDVLGHVEVRLLDAAPEADAPPRALCLDALADLAAVAGDERCAARARLARDQELMGETSVPRVAPGRALRWALRGLPGPGGRDLAEHAAWLAGADALPQARPQELAHVLTGLELAGAALVVAAYGPCLSEIVVTGA